MDAQNYFRPFQLNETGFNIINILMIVTLIFCFIIVPILFRRNLTGKKIMFFGAELLLLGVIFYTIIDYKVTYPALPFITILLGIITTAIGLCYKD